MEHNLKPAVRGLGRIRPNTGNGVNFAELAASLEGGAAPLAISLLLLILLALTAFMGEQRRLVVQSAPYGPISA